MSNRSQNLQRFLLLTPLLLLACQQSTLKRFEFSQRQMGVPFRAVVYAETPQSAEAASDAAFARIKVLNDIFSDYDPQSETRRLCAQAGDGAFHAVSREMIQVLEIAKEWHKHSHGAFDVTVGPIIKLWRKARKTKVMPKPEELAEAKALVGMDLVELNKEDQSVRLHKAGMQLDFGGIAKGYAIEEALRVLAKRGIQSALVDGGGDLAVSAPPPGKAAWRIGVAPLKAEAKPSRHLLLTHQAVATSGDAFQFVEIDGLRYSHICDPKTGLGLSTRSAVTLIAPSATQADLLATALSILGPDKGFPLLKHAPKAAALFVRVAQGKVQTHSSQDFQKWQEQAKPRTLKPR